MKKTKLTARGKRIKKSLEDEYGKKKGDRRMYEYENRHLGIKKTEETMAKKKEHKKKKR